MRAVDRIFENYEKLCSKKEPSPCTVTAYARLGERSARIMLASSDPITVEKAHATVFANTQHKLVPIAASFDATTMRDGRGLYHATLIAMRSETVTIPFEPEDKTKVCMNASATVFMDQNLGCLWDRKTIEGREFLVRANQEDVEDVLKSVVQTTAHTIRMNPDDYKIPVEAGSYVRFMGFDGQEPFIEIGRVSKVEGSTATVSVFTEDEDAELETEIPVHAMLNTIPVQAASSKKEVLDFLVKSYGPKWKEILTKTGAFGC